jgi:hypothetical protein
MKKVKKIITGFLTVFIFMALVLPMTTVKASEEKEVVEKRMYTVTFRAGNIACFDIDKITVSEGMEVTKNYIKVKVAKGDTLAFTVPGWESDARLTSWFSNCLHYEKEAAYGLKAFNGVVGTVVERNTEYVLDYKRLIDPVSYTVSFIDSQTKEQIAAPQITYGNAEESNQSRNKNCCNTADHRHSHRYRCCIDLLCCKVGIFPVHIAGNGALILCCVCQRCLALFDVDNSIDQRSLLLRNFNIAIVYVLVCVIRTIICHVICCIRCRCICCITATICAVVCCI